MALQVWRHGGFGGQTAEGAGGREREAEEDAGRTHARPGYAEGKAGIEVLSAIGPRTMVEHC